MYHLFEFDKPSRSQWRGNSGARLSGSKSLGWSKAKRLSWVGRLVKQWKWESTNRTPRFGLMKLCFGSSRCPFSLQDFYYTSVCSFRVNEWRHVGHCVRVEAGNLQGSFLSFHDVARELTQASRPTLCPLSHLAGPSFLFMRGSFKVEPRFWNDWSKYLLLQCFRDSNDVKLITRIIRDFQKFWSRMSLEQFTQSNSFKTLLLLHKMTHRWH